MNAEVRQPLVSFIIPVRDDRERLAGCLASIRASTYGGTIEIIVADNGSSDGSPEVAKAAGAIVLDLPGVSVSQLRNEAAAVASGEILAMIDADHIVFPAWVSCAVDTLAATGAAATGAYCHVPAGATWVQRAYDRFRKREEGVRDVEWLGSGNLAVRRDVFHTIGGFDTSLETCEDVDLCNRIRRAGHRLVSDDRLLNVHLGDPRTLGALFAGELWRGRDNLKVTLRGPWTLRSLPSTLIPVANLGLIAGTLIGLGGTPWWGPWVGLTGLSLFSFTAAVRALRVTRSSASWRPTDILANVTVAAVYETARALALVFRASHRTRHRPETG